MFAKRFSIWILTCALSCSSGFLFGQSVSVNQASSKTAVDGGAGSVSKSTTTKANTSSGSKSDIKTVNKKKRKPTQVTSVKTAPATKTPAK